MATAQWAADPYGRYQLRYFDGSQWTEHVSDGQGISSVDHDPLTQHSPSAQVAQNRGDQKIAARFADAGMELWFSSEVTIAGGHPRIPQPVERANIAITDQGIALIFDREALIAEPWSRIGSLCVEDENAVTQRLTAARVIFLGVWSLLAKKKIDTSFLTIQLADGPVTVAVIGTSVYGLRSIADSLHRRVGVRLASATTTTGVLPPPSAALATPLPADRLRQLEQLRDDGLISETEFATRRQAIIDAI
jgi:hypothetical protein